MKIPSYIHDTYISPGNMNLASGGNGGYFGLIYDTDEWKIKEFSSEKNAFSLCEYTGRKIFS